MPKHRCTECGRIHGVHCANSYDPADHDWDIVIEGDRARGYACTQCNIWMHELLGAS